MPIPSVKVQIISLAILWIFTSYWSCTPAARHRAADALGEIAVSVCIDTDTVDTCLEKCVTECALRKAREKTQEDGTDQSR